MNNPKVSVSADELSQAIIGSMQDKKAVDVTLLDLKEIPSAITEYFVICTATSFTHLDAIADGVEEDLEKKYNESPMHQEKVNNMEWVVLDYFNVVVHIFSKEKRDFYDLEGLWGDAKFTKFE